MTSNPLVAEKAAPKRTAGTFLIDDIVNLSQELRSGSWAAAGFTGVATTFDLAATVSDPLGSLLAAGFGWIIDHLDPIKSWFEDLVGDPGQVDAFATTYENVARRLDEESDYILTRLESDLGDQTSDALTAYVKRMTQFSDTIAALARACEGAAGGLKYAGMIVEVVHTTVRDALSQLCGAIISWLTEEVLSFGLATGWVIEQVSTRVAQLAGELGGMIRDLITSMKALEKLVDELDKAVGKGRSFLDLFHPNAARGAHTAPWLHDPHAPAHRGDGPAPASEPSPRHAQPDTGPRHKEEQTPSQRLREKLGDTVKTEYPRNPVVEGYAAEGEHHKKEG